MMFCPQCEYPVTYDDKAAKKCPHCGNKLRSAAMFAMLLVSGCCLGCAGLVDDPDMRALKASLKTIDESVITARTEVVDSLKENTTALAAIKSQIEGMQGSLLETRQSVGTLEASLTAPSLKGEEVIKSALEPQQEIDANDSHTSTMIVANPAVVRLFVTHAPFPCPPCNRLKRAVRDGLFDGFEVVDSGGFDGLRSYPAIRFETASSQTGWGVLYGYDDNTIQALRTLTAKEATTALPVGSFRYGPKDSAIVGQRFTVRFDNRQARRRGWPVNSFVSGCTSGSCSIW